MHSQTSHVKQSHDSIFTQDRASFRLIPHALFRRELFGDLPCVDVLGFVNEVGACLAAVERLTTRVSETRVAGQRGADGLERAGQRHGVHHGRGLILRLLGAGGLDVPVQDSFGVLRANIKKCKRLKDLAASLRDIYCSDLTGSVVYILK